MHKLPIKKIEEQDIFPLYQDSRNAYDKQESNLNNNKSRVLLLQERLSIYRIPIYKLISQKYDLTVCYLTKDASISLQQLPFKNYSLNYNKFVGINFIPHLLEYCNTFDAVITLPHFRCPAFCRIPFWHKRTYHSLTWSIGVRASYKEHYNIDKKFTIKDYMYEQILKKSEANIFYDRTPIALWKRRGLDISKFFVAHNSVEVLNFEPTTKRDIFLFVGTLYRQKGLDELIDAYYYTFKYCSIQDFPKLFIVGSGSEENVLKERVQYLKLNNQIQFLGAIYNEKDLSALFCRSIMCISPNQAGLSVLKSMGYGVPYVTKRTAITGGEIFNIIDGENGVIYNDTKELPLILWDAVLNRQKYLGLGEAAYKYYKSSATPQIMANGVIAALDYVFRQ